MGRTLFLQKYITSVHLCFAHLKKKKMLQIENKHVCGNLGVKAW